VLVCISTASKSGSVLNISFKMQLYCKINFILRWSWIQKVLLLLPRIFVHSLSTVVPIRTALPSRLSVSVYTVCALTYDIRTGVFHPAQVIAYLSVPGFLWRPSPSWYWTWFSKFLHHNRCVSLLSLLLFSCIWHQTIVKLISGLAHYIILPDGLCNGMFHV
jgi:hypothetical protein